MLYLHHDFSSAWTFVLKNDSILLYRRAIRLNLYPCTKTEYRTDKHFDVKKRRRDHWKSRTSGREVSPAVSARKRGNAVVYLAEKTGSGKRYAVKVSICDREKLRREAFLLQKFSYPGIPCAVETSGKWDKKLLVMEAVNGKSIGQRMRKGERFSQPGNSENGNCPERDSLLSPCTEPRRFSTGI